MSLALPVSRTQGAEREHGQDSDLNTECHSQHGNWEGGLAGSSSLLLGDGMRSVRSEQLSHASLIFLGVYFFLFVGSRIIIIIIIFQALNCSYLNPGVLSFFPILLVIPLGGRVRSCMVLSCQLGLKNSSPSTSSNSLLPVS